MSCVNKNRQIKNRLKVDCVLQTESAFLTHTAVACNYNKICNHQ